MNKTIFTEEIFERIKLIYLATALIYIIFSLSPTESIKEIIPCGVEIDIILFIFSTNYILNYCLEELAKYFKKKFGILSKITEILFGIILTFLLDAVPFLIDLSENQFTFYVGWILIILFSLRFLITFILQPLNNLYYMIRYMLLDRQYNNELLKIEEDYNIKIKEIDLEYKKKLEEINTQY